MKPVVIAVAITGSVPRKKDNPAVPISTAEQIELTHEAFEAGASLVHIHVRNDDETPSSSPERFGAVQEGIRKHCPGMIVQFSTGGRGRDPSQRGSSLYLRPDMASLSTGSVNFPTIVYENGAAFVEDLATKMKEFGVLPEVEIFDLSHLHGAKRLVDAGRMNASPHVQFVMGVKNALPAEEHLLDLLLGELRRVLPAATWTAAGIGRHQSEVMDWALARGADAVRTGLEDNVRVSRDRLAKSNAELVALAAEAVARHGRKVARPEEARAQLGLRGVNVAPRSRVDQADMGRHHPPALGKSYPALALAADASGRAVPEEQGVGGREVAAIGGDHGSLDPAHQVDRRAGAAKGADRVHAVQVLGDAVADGAPIVAEQRLEHGDVVRDERRFVGGERRLDFRDHLGNVDLHTPLLSKRTCRSRSSRDSARSQDRTGACGSDPR